MSRTNSFLLGTVAVGILAAAGFALFGTESPQAQAAAEPVPNGARQVELLQQGVLSLSDEQLNAAKAHNPALTGFVNKVIEVKQVQARPLSTPGNVVTQADIDTALILWQKEFTSFMAEHTADYQAIQSMGEAQRVQYIEAFKQQHAEHEKQYFVQNNLDWNAYNNIRTQLRAGKADAAAGNTTTGNAQLYVANQFKIEDMLQ